MGIASFISAPTVVTGFDAFGAFARNTSAGVIGQIRSELTAGHILEVLPTSYSRAGERIEELVAQHSPRRLVMLGQADIEGDLRLEDQARNGDEADAPDNDGEARRLKQIAPEGPPTYATSLPVEEIAITLTGRGFVVEFSDDAGGYVCNHVFYRAMHALAGRSGVAAGFVHVPADPGGGLERTCEAVRAVLDVVTCADA